MSVNELSFPSSEASIGPGIQYIEYDKWNRIQCIEYDKWNGIQGIEYNDESPMHRIQGIEYKAYNTMHRIQCI